VKRIYGLAASSPKCTGHSARPQRHSSLPLANAGFLALRVPSCAMRGRLFQGQSVLSASELRESEELRPATDHCCAKFALPFVAVAHTGPRFEAKDVFESMISGQTGVMFGSTEKQTALGKPCAACSQQRRARRRQGPWKTFAMASRQANKQAPRQSRKKGELPESGFFAQADPRGSNQYEAHLPSSYSAASVS